MKQVYSALKLNLCSLLFWNAEMDISKVCNIVGDWKVRLAEIQSSGVDGISKIN